MDGYELIKNKENYRCNFQQVNETISLLFKFHFLARSNGADESNGGDLRVVALGEYFVKYK